MPKAASRTINKIEEFPVKTYYIQKEYFSIEKTVENFNGLELAVYDCERTICDCFKYRIKLDNETFNKALNADVAAFVLARLKNKAKESDRSYQL